MGLNVCFRPTEPPEQPTWFPEPPQAKQGTQRFPSDFKAYPHRTFSANRRSQSARDSQVVWVARPKMHFPPEPVDANGVDSATLGQWGVPAWSVNAFLKERRAWGGFVSPEQLPTAAANWPLDWVFGPLPPQRVLQALSKEILARHPLIGWERAAVYHRYRSRVRPVRTWGELRALPGWDDVDETLLRKYFVLSRKDSLSLHP